MKKSLQNLSRKVPSGAAGFGKAFLFVAGVVFIAKELKQLWEELLEFLDGMKE